ncbi:MAG: DUF4406 domain-containing protein [Alphaproteobacteria bacterium]|nr:DUF4406 domain-containing protein [Alphaproteobacteria bacterium]
MASYKVFVCGPIIGNINAVEDFAKAEEVLQNYNSSWKATSPLDLGVPISKENQERLIRRCMDAVLASDALFLLRGWNRSSIFKSVYKMAKEMGLPIYEFDEYIEEFELIEAAG